jgi:hypothetical protein
MEINPSDKILTPMVTEKAREDQNVSDRTFNSVFEEVLGELNRLDQKGRPAHPEPVVPVAQCPRAQSQEDGSTLGHAKRLLDILDAYQTKMVDPGVTLRDIAPLVRKIETENERLISSADSLSEDDQLRSILNHLAIIASVEVIKFDRGDYV